ncbi:DUF1254 domain-containing protein [Novosphingobium sp. BL-8A]|uniref:DUF1254 domain-containing protein n=1 Tax=Novosphingobium sp. BL-8A TaxID=3127639 RepID=UPI003757A3E3
MADDHAGNDIPTKPIPVDRDNFVRAETDTYFASFVRDGGLGQFVHHRELADIDNQIVVRMNRDTLYSQAVFDLDAGAVTVTLPDSGGRFLSALVIDEDHYVLETFYDSQPHRFSRERGGTRYITVLVRTFVDPGDPADLAKVHALQDAIAVDQPGGPGRFEVPNWDPSSLKQTRGEIAGMPGFDPSTACGWRGEIDPTSHLICTAVGWGGNPARDATYVAGEPKQNDGKTVYRLTVRDVPVDGFWSVTVYNKDGFFERNARNAYSLNTVTARADADGAVTIQFGGCGEDVANCLPIVPGWNYTVRLYRPREEILDGRWTFPEAQPA